MYSASQGHPRGLYLLFATEMWERFSYYGNRALLALFMLGALAFDKQMASHLYGSYTALAYLTPLVGGYVADRYWGNRRSILVGGLLMAAGQFVLFWAGSVYYNAALAVPLFYAGLTLLAIGNGFFKPNISTMVGDLYAPGDRRRDAAYTIFYMGINLGSFLAPLICGYLGDTGNPADFRWGFLTAGVGMLLSVITFSLFKNRYLVGPDGHALGLSPAASRAAGQGQHLDQPLTRVDYQRMAVIGILSLFVVFFWSVFEQAGVSLTYLAEESVNRELFGSGFIVPASWFQSLNPVFILIFAPVMAWLWGRLGRSGREPASPTKMAWGLLLLAGGFWVISVGVQGVAPAIKISLLWLVAMYFMNTMGKLFLSPVGLSLVNKLSPAKFASLMMAVWFAANAAANWLAGFFSGFYPEPGQPAPSFLGWQIVTLHDFFMLFVWFAACGGILLLLLTKPLQKMMNGIR
ncbi:peptide MFS transporter [Laribacter hongkongensis]|uniref:peptide MFS transporter n=1 Tax=Laribacter hongkongensis TaxID=168471 RepID=UPI001EFCF382|nr:peptide MFS transporter [Laribacter hongkongensis]MCG9080574.1 peptide MFS transporter [Laribacter hongkongensis]